MKNTFSFFNQSFKKTIFCTILLLTVSFISWAGSYNSHAGVTFNIDPSTDTNTEIDGFFQGQFNLTKNVFLRTKFSLKTENLFSSEMLQNIPSIFNVNELSVTYAGNLGFLSHYISGFLGNTETLGNDVFLKRQFGISSINSKLTLHKNGDLGLSIIPMTGLGFSYILRMQKNRSFGFYGYYNYSKELKSVDTSTPPTDLGSDSNNSNEFDENITSNYTENRNLNFDIRFAFANNNISFDSLLGFSLPLENASAKDAILVIKRADLHGGLSLLWGNSFSTSLLFQAGITKAIIQPTETEKVISLSDLFFLIEPKFVTKKLTFSFSLFNFPKDNFQDLYFVKNPLGVDVAIYTSNMFIKNEKAELGFHLTFSMPENSEKIEYEKVALQISPFFSTHIGTGELSTAIQYNTQLTNISLTSFKNFFNNTSLTVGYKIIL